MQQVAEGVLPKYACIRDRATAIRGVERCLSEFCVAWSTARLLDAGAVSEIRRDFVFHLKALLEHAPACERHEVRTLKDKHESNGEHWWDGWDRFGENRRRDSAEKGFSVGWREREREGGIEGTRLRMRAG